MRHYSAYLDWYIHVPSVKYDLRSSGLAHFKYDFSLGEIDFSTNYAHGNPKATEVLARMYDVQLENVFVSSEGASGQNARIIRLLAERNRKKNEAVVEYPTYEPLLRQVQEHFPRVRRLERKDDEVYRLDPDRLRKVVSKRTGLVVLTNPHAPSGSVSSRNELEEIMTVAGEHDLYVMCDEVYAEFDRNAVPSIFSVNPLLGIVTTSFTKAYGLGGLKLGIALAKKELVDELYADVLSTVGNAPNVVQLAAIELLTKGKRKLESHRQRWVSIRTDTEKWLNQRALEYFPNKLGVTYWVKTPIEDTHKWINEHAIPKHEIAPVPGAFFLFESGYKIPKSKMIRLGLGSVNPDSPNLQEAFEALENAMASWPVG